MRRRSLLGAVGGAIGATLVGCAAPGDKHGEKAAERLSAWLATASQVAKVESVGPRNDPSDLWADATITLKPSVDQSGLAEFIASFYDAVEADFWSVQTAGRAQISITTEPKVHPELPAVWYPLSRDTVIAEARIVNGIEKPEVEADTVRDPLAHLLDLLPEDWMSTAIEHCSLRATQGMRSCYYTPGRVRAEESDALRQLAEHYPGSLRAVLTGTGSGTITLTPLEDERLALQKWVDQWPAPGSIHVRVEQETPASPSR